MIFGSPLHLNGVVAGFIDLLLAKWTNHRSGLTWLGCVRPIAAREYAWPDKWLLALGLLLCGGACCVGGLFRGCRAASAAGCANIPVLDDNILLVRSCRRITGCPTHASTHGSPNRTSNHSTHRTACGSTGCGSSWVGGGDGWEQEDGCKNSVFDLDTHDCFSTRANRGLRSAANLTAAAPRCFSLAFSGSRRFEVYKSQAKV